MTAKDLDQSSEQALEPAMASGSASTMETETAATKEAMMVATTEAASELD